LAAASFAEQRSHGIRASRSSKTMTRAAGVDSMCRAMTCSVFGIVFHPKEPVPFVHNQFKMLENNLPDFPSEPRRQSVRPFLFDVKQGCVQPEFAFRFRLTGMDVNRFVSFVGIEEQSPAADPQDCRHRFGPAMRASSGAVSSNIPTTRCARYISAEGRHSDIIGVVNRRGQYSFDSVSSPLP